MIDTKEEQIRLYAKQLKIPMFAYYSDVVRQLAPSADYAEFLLELMKASKLTTASNFCRLVR